MVNQTEEALGISKQVGIGSVSSARQRGAMGHIAPADATNALDVLAEENLIAQSNKPKEEEKESKILKPATPLKLTPETPSSVIEPITPEMEDIAEEVVSELNQSVPPAASLRPKSRPDKTTQSAIKKIIELGYIQRRNFPTLNKGEQESLKDYFDSTFRTTSNLIEPENLRTITKFITQALGRKDNTLDVTNQDITKEGVYWCAAFVNHILTEMGADTLGKVDEDGGRYNRLRARKYTNYGIEISKEDMQEGDILLFGYGDEISHVGFYTGERTSYSVNMMGGNQDSGFRDQYDQIIEGVSSVERNIDNIIGVRRVTFEGDASRIAADQKSTDPIFRYFDTPTYEANFEPSSNRRYSQGGTVSMMDQQMSFAFAEGGLRDDGMGEDPVSGNEVPSGSMAKEVRDDIPAQLSEGEYVVPADVVRYYGVKFFEDLRNDAKMGLQDMESRGRIGGEPVPAGGPTNTDDLSPEEMSVIQEMMGMAEGGIVNMYKQQQDLYNPPNPAVGNNMMNAGGQVKGYAPGGGVVPMPGVVGNGSAVGQNMGQQILTAGQQVQPFVAQPLGSSLFQSANTNMAEVTTPTTFVPVKMLNMQTNHSVMANTQQEFDDYSSKGYVVDDGTLKPTPTGGGGGGGGSNPPGNKEPYKDWLTSADFNSEKGIKKFIAGIKYDPSKSKLDLQTLGATMLAGPMAGVATGLGGAFKGGGLEAISDLRAASLIAKAQGLDKLAGQIDTQVADIIKDGPKILDFLEGIFASGKQKANAWAKKNGHDNIEVATTAGVTTTTTTPQPKVVDPVAPINEDNDNNNGFSVTTPKSIAETQDILDNQTTPEAIANTNENIDRTAAKVEDIESGKNTSGQVGFKEGGLMAKGKNKKKK